jgi:hypothetical protein
VRVKTKGILPIFFLVFSGDTHQVDAEYLGKKKRGLGGGGRGLISKDGRPSQTPLGQKIK